MNNADFWASVRTIIAEGFTPEGLLKLDGYAAQFISGKLFYQRFSPQAGVQKEEFVISDQWNRPPNLMEVSRASSLRVLMLRQPMRPACAPTLR